MGTNFYLRHIPSEKDIHIGKSSGGWQFSFKENKDYYESTLKDLVNFLECAIDTGEYLFTDEYGYKYTIEQFVNLINKHKTGWNYITYQKYHPSKYYNEGNDYISEDGTWWCKCEFC